MHKLELFYDIQSAKSYCLKELELLVNKGKTNHETVINSESTTRINKLYHQYTGRELIFHDCDCSDC